MVGPAHRGDLPRGALATTIGSLAESPQAAPLTTDQRRKLEHWREGRWQALEKRTGSLGVHDPDAWYEHLVYERSPKSRHTGRFTPAVLSVFYRIKRLVPRSMQLILRRRLVERQSLPSFPAWPFEAAGSDLVRIAFADALLDRGVESVRFPWFWPNQARGAVTLTHDVESATGLMNASVVARWEESQGFRSSFNIVSDWYPVDMHRVESLKRRGYEIGSHAIHHDHSLFASRDAFVRQLPLLRDAAGRLGAVGFRSPATHRVIEWLAELPFSYDCTMPHSDPFEPIPGGTTTTWPFFHGDVVELPYTAPQDHTLYNLLGHQDSALWQAQLERIVSCNGLFQLLTHPDDDYLGRPLIGKAYREILETISDRDDVWVALPREVADWWRRRARGLTSSQSGVARWAGSGIELAPTELVELVR